MGRVIQAVEIQQRAAVEEILARRLHQPLRRRPPAKAVVALEPDSRLLVKIRNRGGHLAFDQIRVAAGRVVARSRIPARRAKVVAELIWPSPPPRRVAPEEDSARGVPIMDRLEIPLLHESHAHIGVIHQNLRRGIADVGPQGRQNFEKIVAFALTELVGKIIAPSELAGPDLEFVVEEIIQALRGFAGIPVLKGLVKIPHDPSAGAREERIPCARQALGDEDPDRPSAVGRGPLQAAIFHKPRQIDATRLHGAIHHGISANGDRGFRHGKTDFFAANDVMASSGPDLERIPLRLVVEKLLEKIFAAHRPIERVGAQANSHAELSALLRNAGKNLPPCLGKNGRLAGIRPPPRRIGVRVIHLHAADAFRVKFADLPEEPLQIQIPAAPPPEWHLAIARWRIRKTRQGIEV